MSRIAIASISLLLGACDQLFSQSHFFDAAVAGDDVRDADGPDGIDAPRPSVVVIEDLRVSDDVAIGETTEVIIVVSGTPLTAARFELTAQLGAVEMGNGFLAIDDAGNGSTAARYTAPSMAGSDMLTAKVESELSTIAVPIRERTPYGYDTTFAGSTITLGGHGVFAQGVSLEVQGTLRAIGMRSQLPQAGRMVRLGLYDGGFAKIAETAPTTVSDTRTVVDAPRIPITTGTYHIAILTDGNLDLFRNPNTGTYLLKGHAFGAGMPDTLAGSTGGTGTLGLFVEVAH